MAEDLIEGRIIFGDDAVPFQRASVHLILEDTTAADAAATQVARLVVEDVAYGRAVSDGIPFALRRENVPPGRRQSLRVLVDVDGDGQLGSGDYRNAESVPVPPGSMRNVDVRVRRVR